MSSIKGYALDDHGIMVCLLAGTREVSLLQIIETNPGAHRTLL